MQKGQQHKIACKQVQKTTNTLGVFQERNFLFWFWPLHTSSSPPKQSDSLSQNFPSLLGLTQTGSGGGGSQLLYNVSSFIGHVAKVGSGQCPVGGTQIPNWVPQSPEWVLTGFLYCAVGGRARGLWESCQGKNSIKLTHSLDANSHQKAERQWG